MSRRVVVTGAAGFLGSHLCERLLAAGDEVVALDNFVTGSPANLEHLLENPGLRLIRCDVTEYVHVPGPVDAVLHFASPASPIDYLQLPIETLKVGSIGTLHALGLAREKGARFLLASTSETYGDPLIHPQPETYWGNVNPVGPRGVYDEAKRFAEAMTMAYRRTLGVDTKIVRIFNSILADEQVLYDDGTVLRREPVAALAARIGDNRVLDGYRVPSFDADGAAVAGEAIALVGHPTRQPCYEVRVRYGRSIRVTGDHSVFVEGRDGKPVARPVTELTPRDRVAIAGRLDVPVRDRPSVSMLGVAVDAGFTPWQVTVQSPELPAVFRERRSELVDVAAVRSGAKSKRQSAGGQVSRWIRGGYAPLGLLQQLGIRVPADARLRMCTRGAGGALPVEIPVTDEMLWLLGLYVAEGCFFEKRPKSAFINISCDAVTLERASKIIERDLGLHVVQAPGSPSRGPAIFVHSTMLLRLLDHLGLGAGHKRIPGWILGLPLSRLKWFMEGYREGDGVHSGKKFVEARRHEFSTVSEQLKDDLIVAFARFGLVPSVGLYSSTFKQKTGDRRYPFWRLTLCVVEPWSPLDWDQGVTQTLNARRYGDLVFAQVTEIVEIPATPLVYDFSVPGLENFWAGTGVMAHNTFGERLRPNDGRAIPAFICQALRKEPVTVAGDGMQTRSVCYVEDLITGILLLLDSGLEGPVNIGNPHEMSILELAQLIIRLVGNDVPIEFIPRPVDDPMVRQPDITLARTKLGWEPKVPIEDGLRRTIAWFREHPELVQT